MARQETRSKEKHVMKQTSKLVVVLGLTGMVAAFAAEPIRPVTFTKDVAPIFQEKCESCHRTGEMAPMSLVTYEQVRPWAKSIKQRVASRQMPPWHLDPNVGVQKFANDMSLTQKQIDMIVQWSDAGAPQGDPKDMPAAKVWPKDEGWKLSTQFGQPDFVIKSDPYTMPAKAQDAWFKPLSLIPLTESRWVRAVEIRPGTAAVP